MNSTMPNLQVALDNLSIESAFQTLGKGLGDEIDIIEVGTMLLLMEGLRSVDIVRSVYPNKVLVADFKCVAPHFGSQVLKRNPDLMTVLSCAEPHVKRQIAAEAKERGQGQEVQVELYGEDWTWDDVSEWKEAGINHIIYSRPRSRSGPWGQEEVADIERLIGEDMNITATGGLSIEALDVLAGLPIYSLIFGRSVRNAEEPADEVKRIREKVNKLWA